MKYTSFISLFLAFWLVVSPVSAAQSKTEKAKSSQTGKTAVAKKAAKPTARTAAKTAQKPSANKQSGKKSAVKKSTVKKTATKKTTAKKTTAKAPVKNEAKALYGVNGAKLTPAKQRAGGTSYQAGNKTHTTISSQASGQYSKSGTASYYAAKFNGRRTASGEIYRDNLYTAAHKTLAIGSYALVTNLRNGKQVIVKINDRGPFGYSRIIDLSKVAARDLGMIQAGTAQVRVEGLQIDAQGNISGKGAAALRQIALREGIKLNVKDEKTDVPVKQNTASATENSDEANTTASKRPEENTEVNTPQPAFMLKVVVKNRQQAEQLAAKLQREAVIEPLGKQVELRLTSASQADQTALKQQIRRLGQYQIFSYSAQ